MNENTAEIRQQNAGAPSGATVQASAADFSKSAGANDAVYDMNKQFGPAANDPATPQASAIADTQRNAAPTMKGFFNRHTSGYWAVMIPALSVRYLFEAAMKLGVASFKGPSKEARKQWSDKLDTAYAATTGAAMMLVTTFYAKRTYDDIKSVFAEPVAMEIGKKPQDVNFRDIMNSNNTLVMAAKRNFIKYNMRRYAVNLPFFGKHAARAIWDDKTTRGLGDAAVGLGVATNSMYLVNDVFRRKETFFERLQSFVDEKIQHSGQLGDKITGIDLINLYELHARDKDHKHEFSARMDSQEWNDRVKIFGRMADLMNQTYGNEPNREHANFNLAKMISLLGHGMIDSNSPERSCTYIEVANRYGIEAVKDIAKHPRESGADIKYAQSRYGISDAVANDCKDGNCGTSFAAKFAPEPAMSNVDKVVTGRAAANQGAFVQTA